MIAVFLILEYTIFIQTSHLTMRKGEVVTMTDKQLEVIMNLVADKFEGCKDMDEVRRAIQEVREMARKERPE